MKQKYYVIVISAVKSEFANRLGVSGYSDGKVHDKNDSNVHVHLRVVIKWMKYSSLILRRPINLVVNPSRLLITVCEAGIFSDVAGIDLFFFFIFFLTHYISVTLENSFVCLWIILRVKIIIRVLNIFLLYL